MSTPQQQATQMNHGQLILNFQMDEVNFTTFDRQQKRSCFCLAPSPLAAALIGLPLACWQCARQGACRVGPMAQSLQL